MGVIQMDRKRAQLLCDILNEIYAPVAVKFRLQPTNHNAPLQAQMETKLIRFSGGGKRVLVDITQEMIAKLEFAEQVGETNPQGTLRTTPFSGYLSFWTAAHKTTFRMRHKRDSTYNLEIRGTNLEIDVKMSREQFEALESMMSAAHTLSYNHHLDFHTKEFGR